MLAGSSPSRSVYVHAEGGDAGSYSTKCTYVPDVVQVDCSLSPIGFEISLECPGPHAMLVKVKLNKTSFLKLSTPHLFLAIPLEPSVVKMYVEHENLGRYLEAVRGAADKGGKHRSGIMFVEMEVLPEEAAGLDGASGPERKARVQDLWKRLEGAERVSNSRMIYAEAAHSPEASHSSALSGGDQGGNRHQDRHPQSHPHAAAGSASGEGKEDLEARLVEANTLLHQQREEIEKLARCATQVERDHQLVLKANVEWIPEKDVRLLLLRCFRHLFCCPTLTP